MRKRVELLSPVGNMEMLYQAIHNGADAVYLAGKSYGARKFARNFTNEELVQVIEYAHLYGVKVYVTVNIIIYENELDDVLEYIEFLYQNQVDALIMQDLGLISLVRVRYPNLEIHASTQCHNHNRYGLKLWKKLGVKRAVLDREMSISEIKDLDIDIEKEVFIYGALCVCYSGCCLFSSLNGGRSGNRGECVGCCRLPYRKIKNGKVIDLDGKYLLSTKELNTLNYLGELINLGIDCFKIEGRMKSPAYVGYVTRCARNIIDSYYNGLKRQLTREEEKNLMILFNRGFTKGYLFLENNIMNIKSPNHQGIMIGKVIGVKNGKVGIKLNGDNLCQEDGIRFKNANIGMIVNRLYDKKRMLVHQVSQGNICYVDVKDYVEVGDIVLKTVSITLNKSLEEYSYKKIDIDLKVICKIGCPLRIEMTDGENVVVRESVLSEKAIHQGVSEENFRKQLGKLGNTPFILRNMKIDKDDNVFVRLSVLNEIRRELVEELINLRKGKQIHEVKIVEVDKWKESSVKVNNKCFLHVLVRNEEQLNVCIQYGVSSVYVTDYELYLKYKDKYSVYYRVDRVNMREKEYHHENLLVGDLGSTYLYCQNNCVVGDYYLNVVNHANVQFLYDLGVQRVTLSVELNYYQVRELMRYVFEKNKIEMVLYGRIELMIMKHQIDKDRCYLEDRQRHCYPVMTDNGLTHVFHSDVIDSILDLEKYQKLGIEHYRIELFDESKDEVEEILRRIL